MTNWKEIWAKRSDEVKILDHENLLKANGYDNKRSKIVPETLKEAQRYYLRILDASSNDTYFEVGCGSGAFLYDIWMKGSKVSGVDLSKNLVELANYNIPHCDFTICEAIELETETKYDHIFSFGVFFYFPNLEYAEKVILRMIEKANKTVSIYDVQDLDYKEENEAMRREFYGPTYDEDYKGLEHLYMSKTWFIDFAKRHNLHLTIFDQHIEGYENGKYRYNVTMRPNRK